MGHKDRSIPIVAFVCVILSLSLTADACFPAKYWISCLIDSCKLGGKCPGDQTATCRMEKTECNGCKPRWYTPAGAKANCSAAKDLKLCPGGETVVHCKVDSCKWPCRHSDFQGAPCRQSYCGRCAAEYLIKDAWVKCPVGTTGTQGETLPVDTVIGENCIKHPCSINVCIDQRCPAVPNAVCRPAVCGPCRATWYVSNMEIDCTSGQIIRQGQSMNPIVSPPAPWQRTCATGVPLTPCDMKVCDQKICRNFPNAVCRPDGCGGCKDTYYVDNTLVDCLSDECPPNVPFVKCVDDPCKYFGHYCPAAECRASQCGKCEAKFFANGQEIDCAMPPKECNAGVKARVCPWYTCPANICPSNRRLMCRINPCGSRCDYEFVDIYNSEMLPCRVFDGDGTPRQSAQPEITFTDTNQIPKLGNIIPEPTPLGIALPQSVDISHSVPRAAPSSAISPSTAVGNRFNVEPVFTNPGPPIMDPDLLSILRSFPHEMIQIPSASIQTALKRDTGGAAAAIAQQQIVLPSRRVAPLSEPLGVIRAGKPKYLENVNPTFPQQNINIPIKQALFETRRNSAPLFDTGRNAPPSFDAGSNASPSFDAGSNSAPSFDTGSNTAPLFDAGSNTAELPLSVLYEQNRHLIEAGNRQPVFNTGSNTQPLMETGSNTQPLFDTGSNSQPLFDTGSNSQPLFNTGSNTQPLFDTGSNTQPLMETGGNNAELPLSVLYEQNRQFIETGNQGMSQPNTRFPQQNEHGFNPGPMKAEPVLQKQPTSNQVPAQSMKNFFTASGNSFGNQLLDIAKSGTIMIQDVPAETPFRPDQAVRDNINNNVPKQQTKPLYPELNQMPSGSIAAGKPKNFNSQVIGQKRNAPKGQVPQRPANGVPISMSMFSQWASL